ncbi:MAG: hypothetical protein ACTSQQ_15590, partial [Candidatus Helarchaeota archaeon]
MTSQKHRTGIGFEPCASSGLMEHTKYGVRMENAFQNSFINTLFDLIIRFSTSDRTLQLLRYAKGRRFIKISKKLFDVLCIRIDRMLTDDLQGAKAAFLGKVTGSNYWSAIGGYILEMLNKYVSDWS